MGGTSDYEIVEYDLGTKSIGANSSAVYNGVTATYGGKTLKMLSATCNHDMIVFGYNYTNGGITAFNHYSQAQSTTVLAYAWYK